MDFRLPSPAGPTMGTAPKIHKAFLPFHHRSRDATPGKGQDAVVRGDTKRRENISISIWGMPNLKAQMLRISMAFLLESLCLSGLFPKAASCPTPSRTIPGDCPAITI